MDTSVFNKERQKVDFEKTMAYIQIKLQEIFEHDFCSYTPLSSLVRTIATVMITATTRRRNMRANHCFFVHFDFPLNVQFDELFLIVYVVSNSKMKKQIFFLVIYH